MYRNDGQCNAFMQSNVKDIRHDLSDTLQVATADSLYKIPLAAVDSIGLHAFRTVYNRDVVLLAPYAPYVQAVSVEDQTISFSRSLPDAMKFKKGDILFSEFSSAFPDGYAGRVLTTDGYSCSTELVGFDDIYEKVIMFAEIHPTDSNGAGTGKGPASDAAPADRSMSFNLTDNKFSVKSGPVSASVSFDLDPTYSTVLEKSSADSKATLTVDFGLKTSAEVEVTLSGTGEYTPIEVPLKVPILPFPIPACPNFAIGLDISPIIEIALEGSISLATKLTSDMHCSVTYCDNRVTGVHPSIKASIKNSPPKVKAEGKLFVGGRIYPNLQATGGVLKIGPSLDIGPAATITLDVDPSGVVNCAYDVIKDSKFSLSLDGKLELAIYAKHHRLLKSAIPDFPFSFGSLDLFFVPEFSAPVCNPVKVEDVGVSCTATRDLLLPVTVGMDILEDKSVVRSYTHDDHIAQPTVMKHSFSGFEKKVTYTVVPTYEIFGKKLQASPSTKFRINDEIGIETGNATAIKKTSARIYGTFPAGYNDEYTDYGLLWSETGQEWNDVKKPEVTKGYFRADLENLTGNTGYRYQAYASTKDTTLFGEQKYFLTGVGDYIPEFKDPGTFRIDFKSSRRPDYADVRYGYVEKKGSTFTYHHRDSDSYPYYMRLDEQRGMMLGSNDGIKWGDWELQGELGEKACREHYLEYLEGKKERKAKAEEIGYHAFEYDMADMAFFAEELPFLLWQQGFDKERRESYFKNGLIGTDKVCGVECNVYYFNFRGMPEMLWVDPNTSLTLRMEADGWIFEVTRYEMEGYDFNKE